MYGILCIETGSYLYCLKSKDTTPQKSYPLYSDEEFGNSQESYKIATFESEDHALLVLCSMRDSLMLHGKYILTSEALSAFTIVKLRDD